MRQISTSYRTAKVRGVKRRIKRLWEWVDDFKDFFPECPFKNQQYKVWYDKLPVSSNLVEGKATNKIRKECILALLKAGEYLLKAKPAAFKQTRVVVNISFPDMFSSSIDVFFDDDGFDSFYNRNDDYQKWIPIKKKKAFSEEWTIAIPKGMTEQIYKCIVNDEDDSFESELWVIGEINRTHSNDVIND